MGLAVTLKITELDENRMFLKRSRFPKAMGIMMLCISSVFLVMYKAAAIYIWLLFYSSSILDKGLFFAIMISLLGFPLLGFFLLFYDKKILVDKKLEEICIWFKFFFIPIWRIRIKFTKIDEIIIENVCNSKTVAMRRDAAKGTGKGIRVGYWLMSLKGKDLGKFYFDRNPKKEEILSYAENLSRLTSKKVVLLER